MIFDSGCLDKLIVLKLKLFFFLQGVANLVKYGNLPELIDIVTHAKCNNETDSLILKSAMWAIGHISTSKYGVQHLMHLDTKIFEKFIYLAKSCEVYSIRATALYVLGLFGSTKIGADVLYKLGIVE